MPSPDELKQINESRERRGLPPISTGGSMPRQKWDLGGSWVDSAGVAGKAIVGGDDQLDDFRGRTLGTSGKTRKFWEPIKSEYGLQTYDPGREMFAVGGIDPATGQPYVRSLAAQAGQMGNQYATGVGANEQLATDYRAMGGGMAGAGANWMDSQGSYLGAGQAAAGQAGAARMAGMNTAQGYLGKAAQFSGQNQNDINAFRGAQQPYQGQSMAQQQAFGADMARNQYDYGNAMRGAIGAIDRGVQAYGDTGRQLDYMRRVQTGQAGPSLAELQQQRGLEDSLAAQVAASQSGPGGFNAAAQAQAAQQAGDQRQRFVNDQAQLRAAEQMQARGQVNDLLAQRAGQAQGIAGLNMQATGQVQQQQQLDAATRAQLMGLQQSQQGIDNSASMAALQAQMGNQQQQLGQVNQFVGQQQQQQQLDQSMMAQQFGQGNQMFGQGAQLYGIGQGYDALAQGQLGIGLQYGGMSLQQQQQQAALLGMDAQSQQAYDAMMADQRMANNALGMQQSIYNTGRRAENAAKGAGLLPSLFSKVLSDERLKKHVDNAIAGAQAAASKGGEKKGDGGIMGSIGGMMGKGGGGGMMGKGGGFLSDKRTKQELRDAKGIISDLSAQLAQADAQADRDVAFMRGEAAQQASADGDDELAAQLDEAAATSTAALSGPPAVGVEDYDTSVVRALAERRGERLTDTAARVTPKTYEYTAEAKRRFPGQVSEGRQLGFMAQDAERAGLGYMVDELPDGTKVVDQKRATSTAVAVGADNSRRIQELEEKVSEFDPTEQEREEDRRLLRRSGGSGRGSTRPGADGGPDYAQYVSSRRRPERNGDDEPTVMLGRGPSAGEMGPDYGLYGRSRLGKGRGADPYQVESEYIRRYGGGRGGRNDLDPTPGFLSLSRAIGGSYGGGY